VPAGQLTSYTDPIDGFTISVPAGWVFGEGEIGGNKSFSGASGELLLRRVATCMTRTQPTRKLMDIEDI
jgi:hypothetical protein